MLRSVAWATNAPLFGGFQRTVYLEGQPRDEGARIFATVNNIEDGYFETIGTAFRSGRDFTTADREDSVPVAIINEAMVEQFFPETDPIGKRFQFYGDDFYREIVGVVATAKYVTLGEDPVAVIFSPRRQAYTDAMVLHIRTNGEAADALARAQRILREACSRSWCRLLPVPSSACSPRFRARARASWTRSKRKRAPAGAHAARLSCATRSWS